MKAPAGCTQFHFGQAGIVKSFNFEGVQYLNNQNYRICIRSERQVGSCCCLLLLLITEGLLC